MKKIFILTVIGLFCLYIILLFRPSLQINEQNDSIVVYIENQLKDDNVKYINVKNMILFKWDELFIIRPYASEESISNVIGTNYGSYNFSGLVDEATKKIIFLRDKKIVYDEDFNSHIFNFNKHYYEYNEELVIKINSEKYNRELNVR